MKTAPARELLFIGAHVNKQPCLSVYMLVFQIYISDYLKRLLVPSDDV